MDEPDRITQDQILEIRARVEEINHKLGFMLSATPKARENAYAVFGNSRNLARIYLAVDGKRTLDQLTSDLNMHKQDVSSGLSLLWKEGLVDRRSSGRNAIYSKNQFEKILRISRYLKTQFNLGANG
ncbi:hypothetical protein KAX06_05930 [candidate division WOR-3 bacterium]|nr:hypothetical protein [candidate division WOR-3 bacterium]